MDNHVYQDIDALIHEWRVFFPRFLSEFRRGLPLFAALFFFHGLPEFGNLDNRPSGGNLFVVFDDLGKLCIFLHPGL